MVVTVHTGDGCVFNLDEGDIGDHMWEERRDRGRINEYDDDDNSIGVVVFKSSHGMGYAARRERSTQTLERLVLMDSSSEKTLDLCSNTEINNSPNDSVPMPTPIDEILPAVVDAEKNEMVLHEVPAMVDMKRQNMSEPLAVAPLRMVPFGGKRPVPFSEHALARLREQKLGHCSRQQEVEIPPWLKNHELYVEGNWTVFTKARGGGRSSDWTYVHKGYRRKFRSSCEVDQFLKTKETTDMFKGRKLQKMMTDDSDGQCTGIPFLLISNMLYF
ncbi:hypothetical protein BS78_07G212500 [Paspalum vaginatum]|nr:hypothetical protein BS78_07G212500 [Paspalum vaginatum]